MRIIERDIVGAALISSDDKVLLIQNAKGGVYQDMWLIPGGGVEEGETKEQALIREMKEEILHDISNHNIKLLNDKSSDECEKTLNTGEKVLVKMNFYQYNVRFDKTANELGQEFGEELAALRWFSQEELVGIKASPTTIDVLKMVGFIN